MAPSETLLHIIYVRKIESVSFLKLIFFSQFHFFLKFRLNVAQKIRYISR